MIIYTITWSLIIGGGQAPPVGLFGGGGGSGPPGPLLYCLVRAVSAQSCSSIRLPTTVLHCCMRLLPDVQLLMPSQKFLHMGPYPCYICIQESKSHTYMPCCTSKWNHIPRCNYNSHIWVHVGKCHAAPNTYITFHLLINMLKLVLNSPLTATLEEISLLMWLHVFHILHLQHMLTTALWCYNLMMYASLQQV